MENDKSCGRPSQDEMLSAQTKARRLRNACEKKRIDLVEKWLRLRADPNDKDERMGDAALAIAIRGRCKDMAAMLIDAGARDQLNREGDSYFILAMRASPACALLLAERGGFDLSRKSAKGETALMIACSKASMSYRSSGATGEERAAALAAVRLGLSLAPLEIKAQDEQGRTALIRAARKCGAPILGLLMPESNVQEASFIGETALMSAAFGLNWAGVDLLLPYSNLSAVDETGRDAAAWAEKNDSPEGAALAKHLRDYGAALAERRELEAAEGIAAPLPEAGTGKLRLRI